MASGSGETDHCKFQKNTLTMEVQISELQISKSQENTRCRASFCVVFQQKRKRNNESRETKERERFNAEVRKVLQ